MVSVLPIFIFVYLSSHCALAQKFSHIDPTCIPLCDGNSENPNIPGNPPCLCNFEWFIPGCTIAPCGPGDDASESYSCQCTEYFQPYQCVTLQCDNGTTAVASSCPSNSYPTSNYPSSNYQSSNYPSSNYPSSYYPPPNYQHQSYPSANYPSSYGYPSPSYSTYSPSYALCNNYCGCEPYLPADCTDDSIPPIIGGPACACNMDTWLTGCTLKPCQDGDLPDDDYLCECTPSNSPDFCHMPRCTKT